MNLEGTNPKLITVSLLLIVGAYFAFPWLQDFKQHNTWDKLGFRNRAFGACVDICNEHEMMMIDVLRDKHYVDESVHELIKQVSNETCNRDCDRRIQ